MSRTRIPVYVNREFMAVPNSHGLIALSGHLEPLGWASRPGPDESGDAILERAIEHHPGPRTHLGEDRWLPQPATSSEPLRMGDGRVEVVGRLVALERTGLRRANGLS